MSRRAYRTWPNPDASQSRIRFTTRWTAPCHPPLTLSDLEGNNLLSEKIDGDLQDAFDWQDSIGAQVTDAVPATICEVEHRKNTAKGIDAMSAEEWRPRRVQ